MGEIHLNDALAQMQMRNHKGEPQPFSIEWWTCDRTRKTGGELKRVEKAILTKNDGSITRHAIGAPGKRRVNEFKNQHRNILDKSQTDAVRMYNKVHIRLIHSFNDQIVKW